MLYNSTKKQKTIVPTKAFLCFNLPANAMTDSIKISPHAVQADN